MTRCASCGLAECFCSSTLRRTGAGGPTPPWFADAGPLSRRPTAGGNHGSSGSGAGGWEADLGARGWRPYFTLTSQAKSPTAVAVSRELTTPSNRSAKRGPGYETSVAGRRDVHFQPFQAASRWRGTPPTYRFGVALSG